MVVNRLMSAQDAAGVAFTSTLPSGKPNLFWTTAVNSLIRRPFSPSTFWVLETVTQTTVNKPVTKANLKTLHEPNRQTVLTLWPG